MKKKLNTQLVRIKHKGELSFEILTYSKRAER